MKKVIILLFWLFSVPAFASGPIYGLSLFDTGAVICPIPGLSSTWSPSMSGFTMPIYIKKVMVWVGADYGFRGDLGHGFHANNKDKRPDGSSVGPILISNFGWDHYSDVKSMAGEIHTITWNGDYIRLEPDDTLTFSWSCNRFSSAPTGAQWRTAIWYSFNP